MSFMIIFISYVLQKAEDAISTFSKPTEKLHTIIQSFAKVFDLYKPHISVFYQESKYLKPHHVKIINEKRDCYRKIVYNVLEEGKQQAEFRLELPTSIIAMSILEWSIGRTNGIAKMENIRLKKSLTYLPILFFNQIGQ